MDWLTTKMGGRVYSKGKKEKEHHSPRYDWCINGGDATGFLNMILPFLVLKKVQAELALIFAETYKSPWKVRHNKMTKAGWMLRERLTDALQGIQ